MNRTEWTIFSVCFEKKVITLTHSLSPSLSLSLSLSFVLNMYTRGDGEILLIFYLWCALWHKHQLKTKVSLLKWWIWNQWTAVFSKQCKMLTELLASFDIWLAVRRNVWLDLGAYHVVWWRVQTKEIIMIRARMTHIFRFGMNPRIFSYFQWLFALIFRIKSSKIRH